MKKLAPILVFISFVIPIFVMGLFVWQGINLLNQSQMPNLKEDFKLIAFILIGGFSLLSLTAALLVEKKINFQFLSIKNTLLKLMAKLGMHSHQIHQSTHTVQEINHLLTQFQKAIRDNQQQEKKKYYALALTVKMKALMQLSTNMAHEINNPLAAILGHTQIAKGKSKNSQIQNHLDIIEKEIRKISELARYLLKFAQNTPDHFKAFNIKQVISNIIDQQQLIHKDLVIQKHLMSTQEIYGSVHQIQQVIINLINNAVDAMEKSHTKILSIHLRDLKNALRIQIQDTGRGISSDIKERIFEPFFTTKKTQKMSVNDQGVEDLQGYGLGLSVAYSIVQGHKGHITVESEVNKGTLFTIDIPSSMPLHLQKEQTGLQKQSDFSLKIKSVPLNKKSDILPVSKDRFNNQKQIIKTDDITLDQITQRDIPMKDKITPQATTTPLKPSLSEQNIDFQINHLKPHQKAPQSSHFSIAKNNYVKSKALDFKVKIRPAKIKNKNDEI